MYGDTSELHFLQTTKSSGPLATQAILRAVQGPARTWRLLGQRGRRDLPHDLVQVVVRLVHDLLARRAVAALDQVDDALQLGGRAEILRVLGEPVVDAPREHLGRHALEAGEVDELAVEAVARSDPAVLVEHLVRVLG